MPAREILRCADDAQLKPRILLGRPDSWCHLVGCDKVAYFFGHPSSLRLGKISQGGYGNVGNPGTPWMQRLAPSVSQTDHDFGAMPGCHYHWSGQDRDSGCENDLWKRPHRSRLRTSKTGQTWHRL